MPKIIASDAAFIRDGTRYRTASKPEKVTGTAVSGILGLSPWETPFSIACRLLGLYREDIDDKPAVKAGKILEGSIIEHLRTRGYDTLAAEDVFSARSGDHGTWEHDFDDPIFGGHVDGITADGAIVEIKTTSNPESWIEGVPEHYWLQASLYAHFLGADRIIFAVGVLGREDTSNPYGWAPTEENTFIYEVEKHPDLDKYLTYIREWYSDYILEGCTPDPDLGSERDTEIIEVLDAQLDDPQSLLGELESVQDRIKEMKELTDRESRLKELLVLHMDHNRITAVDGDRMTYTLSSSTRTAVDTDALKRDGLYDKYSKRTTVRSIRAKKRK